jgi:ribose transport system substrate-binding protein
VKAKKGATIVSVTCLLVLFAIVVPNAIAQSTAKKSVLLGYAGWYLADPFQAALEKQTILDAQESGVAYLQPTDSRADAAKQFTDIQTLIGQGANVIITMPADAQAIVPAIKYAKSKNVAVVTIDMAPDGESAYMTVRADNVKMGEIGAEWIGKTLKGKGKVLDLQGELTNSNGRDRTNGFEKYMATHFPGITVVGRPTKWQTELAANAAQTVLSTDPNINAIFLQSDAIMLAATLNVLKSLNKAAKAGERGHIYLISIDGSPFALDKIRSGELDACVSQPLDLYCKYGIKYAIDAINGVKQVAGPTDHDSTISFTLGALQDQLTSPLITKANVEDPKLWGNMAK